MKLEVGHWEQEQRLFEDPWEQRTERGAENWLQFAKWPPEVNTGLAQWSPGPGSRFQNQLSLKSVS